MESHGAAKGKGKRLNEVLLHSKHGNKDGEELIRPIYYENMRRNDIV